MSEARVPALTEFGKIAKELLYGSRTSGVFQFDEKVSVTRRTAAGVTLGGTVARTLMAPEKVDATALIGLSGNNCLLDAIIATDGTVNVSASLLELLPGLKLVANVRLPDFAAPTSLTMEYAHEQFSLRTMLGMTPAPVIGVAGSIGHQGLLVGGDATYDTGKVAIGTWNLGVAYHTPDYQTAVLMTDQGQKIKTTYGHVLDSKDIVGLEVEHTLAGSKGGADTSDTTLGVGYARLFESGAMGKARLQTNGALSLLYEQALKEGGKVTVTSQLNVRDFSAPPRLGFSLTLG